MIPRVGLLNNPPPNPEDYNQGTAIYVNEPGFDSIVFGSRKPECKAFKRLGRLPRNPAADPPDLLVGATPEITANIVNFKSPS